MEKILLKNVVIENTRFEILPIFLDDNKNIIILPSLWALHIYSYGSVFKWQKKSLFTPARFRFNGQYSPKVEMTFCLKPVADNTTRNYLGHLFKFIEYINELHKTNKTPSAHYSELVNTRFINHYLNEYLPDKLQSLDSLRSHQSAISAYYAFLHELEIKEVTHSIIYKKTHQLLADLDCRSKKINYVSKAERSALLLTCSNQRDRLIIRMGFEVGLRTEENCGLILNDFKAKNSQQRGLLRVFDELNTNPLKQSFEYALSGKFTKNGKTRNIYFDRNLLTAMKKYFETERSKIVESSGIKVNSLFIRADNSGAGRPISAEHGSNTFHQLLKQLTHLNPTLSYHDLRHSFATELYHAEILDSNGHENRSESAALIVVSERLGHKSTSTTRRYIRLRQQMLRIEELNYA